MCWGCGGEGGLKYSSVLVYYAASLFFSEADVVFGRKKNHAHKLGNSKKRSSIAHTRTYRADHTKGEKIPLCVICSICPGVQLQEDTFWLEIEFTKINHFGSTEPENAFFFKPNRGLGIIILEQATVLWMERA